MREHSRYRARYRRITNFFARMLVSIIWWDILLPHLGGRNWARRTRPNRWRKYAASFRRLAVEMGGVLIKVGQFLSSRVDILPDEIIQELEGLQDEVAPESFAAIQQVAQTELGLPLEQLFAWFDPTPLAAASLGQVHRALITTLPWETSTPSSNGFGNVVVKIQRPDIETIITTDLRALKTVGSWLQRYPPVRKRANVPQLLEEFSRILYEEIDYLAEGRNAETFANNFRNQPQVRVPRVLWAYTTRRVLTLENVFGIKITDYDKISAAGVSRAAVASRLLDTYLQQIFEDGFFHADPHPGNLFVRPLAAPGVESSLVDWELTFVDFGMVGRVPPSLKEGLRELLIGVGTKDVARVIKAYQMLDILLPGADLKQIEKAEQQLFERYWGKNMSELTSISLQEIREFAEEFRELLYQLPFQVPQNFIFLGRAVGILSGMCTGLDPQFNLWDHLAPYARKILMEEARISPQTWFSEVEKMARLFFSLPGRLDRTLAQIEQGRLSLDSPDVARQVKGVEIALQQLSTSLLFLAFFVGGIILVNTGQEGAATLSFSGALVSLIIILRLRKQP